MLGSGKQQAEHMLFFGDKEVIDRWETLKDKVIAMSKLDSVWDAFTNSIGKSFSH